MLAELSRGLNLSVFGVNDSHKYGVEKHHE